jgi:hypothetical protein
MLSFEKASKIIEDHFANLTDEEFITNLKEYCPRVFEKDKNLDETEQQSSVLEAITNLQPAKAAHSLSQQSSFKTPQEIDTEILEEKSLS